LFAYTKYVLLKGHRAKYWGYKVSHQARYLLRRSHANKCTIYKLG